MRKLYSLALFLWTLLAAPYYLLRVARGRYRASLADRLGRIRRPRIEEPAVWIHACSVGEVEAVAPIVAILKRELPERRLIVSTVTETGQARAAALFPELERRYLPYDFRFAVKRHLDELPRLERFLIMETELWPNLILELARRGVPIAIVNGRISDRAWPRYRRVTRLLRPILALIGVVAARTDLDAERFRRLGAPRVATTGNVKFDRPAAAPPADSPAGRFLLFGSTHPGEEEIAERILDRLRPRFPELRAIVAPRHIERAAALARARGWPLRSQGWDDGAILLLDTHGELAGLYAIAEVAFIGGSFVPVGGHNPLEAAAHGVPVVWGPHVENFRDATAILAGNGGWEVADEEELLRLLARLLDDPDERRRAGEKARLAVAAQRGAAERAWAAIR